MAMMADSVNEFLAALVRCQPDRSPPDRGNTIALKKVLKKVLDKSTKAGVTSVSVFVGAYEILYMKFVEMANN
jgi:hypothetical protein